MIVALLFAIALGAYFTLSPKEKSVTQKGPIELTLDEKRQLLELARQALTAELQGTEPPSPDPSALAPALREEAACFVTLTENGVLRGCILDSFDPHEPIYRNVMRNVVLAATVDARFLPVSLSELGNLSIEISILGKPYLLPFGGPDDLLASLRPAVDGVILTTTYGTSTFLPQVWEQLPDPEEFLSELCRKQGAPGDCWKGRDLLRVQVYRVNHFSESGSDASSQTTH
jgi:AmmeMemoRadiSam system protein A